MLVKEQETVGDKTRRLKTSIRLARFEAINIDFEIEVRDGYTVLSAATDEIELNDININRIFEAFCFVTANPEPWSILIIIRNGAIETRVRAVKTKKIKSRTPPPISFQKIQENKSVWQLFESYLKHGTSNNVDFYHPISRLFYSILESGKASLDVEALTLSVSIESLLNDELSHLYSISSELNKNIECVEQIINESETLDADFKNRMQGSISAMKKARAKDILFVLRDGELVDRELVKTYGELRNKTAHGARDSGADIQNYFNQVSAVLVLFFQLVFLIIKYNGEYTDYGSYQYPTKIFEGRLP